MIIAWLLSAVVASHLLADPQVQPPVFRGGVYLVPIELVLISNKQPWVGLTADDFIVICEKKEYAPVDVTHLADTPNRYTIFFKPTDALRDGKSHDVRIKVKLGQKWRTLPTKWPAVFARPTG